MEFVDLSRYLEVPNALIPPFSKLRNMRPVVLTSELQLSQEPENLSYAQHLAAEGTKVVKIRRLPPPVQFADRLTFPRRVQFEMTSECNVLCHMCPRQDFRRPSIPMPKALYKRVLNELNEHGIEHLAIYHIGEALTHPDFEEIVSELRGKKNLGLIWMSTNGQIFDETAIRFVLNSSIDYVNFSAHAVTETTYKKVMPDGDFDLAMDHLNTFYRLKGDKLPSRPFLHCQMIEQETTRHEVDAFIEAHHARADVVSVNMLEYSNMPNNEFGLTQRDRGDLKSCTRISRNDCFILSNGEVVPCDGAYNGEISYGNVNEKSLFEIWNSPRRFEMVRLNEEKRLNEVPFCCECTDYDI